MKRHQFVLLSPVLAMALVVSGGIVPTAACSEPTALVAPSLSEVAQSPPTPYFTNVTDEVGLTGVTGFRVSIADVNGDDYPDLILHQVPKPVPQDCNTCKDLVLYLNDRGRRFVDSTDYSGVRASRRGTNDRRSNLAVFADVDNDGDLDLFSGIYADTFSDYTDNGDRNDLLLNDGTGRFELAPNSPFHQERFWNTTSATFLDYNLDGNVDLFVGNWFTAGKGGFLIDQLYRGNGDGTFANVTASAGLEVVQPGHWQPSYGVSAADTNDDGFMDLFSSNYCRNHSIHWQNDGDGTFTQVQESTHYGQHIAEPGAAGTGGTCSWGSMPRDFDNDGDVDFFEIITHGHGDGGYLDGEFSRHSTILVNNNNVFSWDFYRVSGRADDDPNIRHHGDHYASWFDIENDGLADLVLTESAYGNDRLYLFKQVPDHTLSLVTSQAGLDSVNAASLPTHNVSPLDYDLDGDEDLLIGFGSDDGIQLWRNDVGNQNHWLTVFLEGAGIPGHGNRNAIGARVEVTAGGKTYTRDVYAGNGHFGPQAPLSLTFGLGQATRADRIVVHWPNENRTSSELSNIAANQFIKIHEPLAPTVEVAITRFIQIDDPDPLPFQGDGDYYAAVTIDGELAHSGVVEGTDFEPADWVFSKVVDRDLDSIPVNIRIMDEDVDADDNIDVNPTDGVTDLNLILDLNTGEWTGDVEFPLSFSQGDGDTEHPIEGGERGKVFFDISVLNTLNVRAFIDGHSYLILQGDTVYWRHFERAAPGRLWQSTVLNGMDWSPTWPDEPTSENRDCDGCESSRFVGVPPLEPQPQTVTLDILQARERAEIIQQPDESNGYTLIVEFDDVAPPGADWYEIDLSYVTGTTLNVRAFIDGRSQLVLQGDTAYWRHFEKAAPGRLWQSTVLNGTHWSPTWPDEPTSENRNCGGCESSRFEGVPLLALQAQTVGLDIVQARERVDIIQQPDQSNGFTLIVEFDDIAPPGADWYEINLTHLESPTAIDLLSFTAEAGADHVTLAWETGTEVDNAGFNLHRATAADGPYTKLNDALIPAEGDPVSGASYVYTDSDVVERVTYYYKLEDVDIHGVTTLHGPVPARVQPRFRRPSYRPTLPRF
jgi:hypothetical protein